MCSLSIKSLLHALQQRYFPMKQGPLRYFYTPLLVFLEAFRWYEIPLYVLYWILAYAAPEKDPTPVILNIQPAWTLRIFGWELSPRPLFENLSKDPHDPMHFNRGGEYSSPKS